MKYLIVDDEHEIYKQMFMDVFLKNKHNYYIEEIKRMQIPKILKPFYGFHFSEKINRHIFLPFKSIWIPFYKLHKYHFDENELYCIIFLNGSLRLHFSRKYLEKIKAKHKNVKLVMILYDSFSNPSAKRAISMIPIFDTVFSFDSKDCKKYNFEHIYATFSKPNNLYKDEKYHTSAFFVGFAQGRLNILKRTFKVISNILKNNKFLIAGVKEEEKEPIPGVTYNKVIPYQEELMYSYNSDCIVEVVRDGQSGVTLRTCEAIAFNKKLLTNNSEIKLMPFYDERYMSVFNKEKDIDLNFLIKDIEVKYENNEYFSPINILKRLSQIYK